jgi:hypothetical protein
VAVEVKLMAYTEEELDQRVKDYFSMYHPLGYMTSLSSSYYDEKLEVYVAVIQRLSSCD